MKKLLFCCLLLVSAAAFSQNINPYRYVIVPMKFDFQKKTNQYRISSNLKFELQKLGFIVFYADESLPLDLAQDRCKALYADLVKSGSFVITKLQLQLKDCQGQLLFSGTQGKSKQKEFEPAYTEALLETVSSLRELHYEFDGSLSHQPSPQPQVVAKDNTEAVVTPGLLFAQPTSNGYQLVDTTPKVVLKLTKTSQPDYYLAAAQGRQGVVYLKDGQWIFDYYVADQLVSEKLSIKF